MAEPNAGPATAPKLVTAESQPRLLVRCSGGETSATYACTTAIVPPPRPWTMRASSSAATESAAAKSRYAAAVTRSPARIAGRRP
jgi:hypothetical protein